MLASSVPSIRTNVTLASPLDPAIAKMMADLNGGQVETSNIRTPVAKAVLVSHETNIAAFVRLRAFTLSHKSSAVLGAGFILGLQKNLIQTKQTYSLINKGTGKCYFSVNIDNHDDIFIMLKKDGEPLTLYLTNSKLEWRAAAINTPGNPRPMTKEESAEGFNALIEFWIENSKTVPSINPINS
jgi:hypothetical protein